MTSRPPVPCSTSWGVKPGFKVSVVGLDDPLFLRQLHDRSVDVSTRPRKGSDLVFFYMDARSDLPRLKALRSYLRAAGCIWALWPKGRREFREDDIRAFGPDAGLVDVKVVAFSETLSALKMVIPVAQR